MVSFRFLQSSPGAITPRETRSDLLAVQLIGDLARAESRNSLGSRLARTLPVVGQQIAQGIMANEQAKLQQAEAARQEERMRLLRERADREATAFELDRGIVADEGINLGPSPGPAQDFGPTAEGLFEGAGGGISQFGAPAPAPAGFGQFRADRLSRALTPPEPDLAAPAIDSPDVIVAQHPAGSRDIRNVGGREVDFGPVRVLPDGRRVVPSLSAAGRERAARIEDRQIAGEQGLEIAAQEADINLDLFKDKQRFLQQLKQGAGVDVEAMTPNQQRLALENQAEQVFEQGQALIEQVETNLESIRQGEAGILSSQVRAMSEEELLGRAVQMGSIPILLRNAGYLEEGGDALEAFEQFTKDMRQRRIDLNREVEGLARGQGVSAGGSIPRAGRQRLAQSMAEQGLSQGQALDRMRELQEKHPERVTDEDIFAILQLMASQ